MKKITLLTTLLSMSSAFANPPSVGDYAKYQFTTTHPSGAPDVSTAAYTLTFYDSGKGAFLESIDGVVLSGIDQGRPTHIETTYKPSIKPNGGDFSNILTICGATGGQIQNIDLGYGTIQSCYYSLNGSWVANVPFGFVKTVTTNANGDTTTMKLLEYKFGK